ncbi:NucA/NucB deoxyribonuclease domain-containing protein [Stenotrophomonas sp. NPDC077461]|uniref:NucA/NucB deoxyribonuclease domain-containing protein n=1 Tax=Stenotrophomonas sp. NPDC077461 TaxID=3414698 RepID=UPI003C2DA956
MPCIGLVTARQPRRATETLHTARISNTRCMPLRYLARIAALSWRPAAAAPPAAAPARAASGFADYPAVFEVSLSNPDTDESAEHIKVAQSILPGNIGYWHHDAWLRGAALTRTSDARLKTANRTAAGKLCRTRFPESAGAGLNCDEYPFAATNQGASVVPESSMSVRYILGEGNQKVGRRLGNFFCTAARVLDGEQFRVKVVE